MPEKIAHIEPASSTVPRVHADAGHDQAPKANGMIVQPSLYVSAVDDPLEKEAETVSEQVMRMPAPGAAPPPPEEGSNGIWRLANTAAQEGGVPVNERTASEIRQQQGGGAKMDDSTKSFMEARFGSSFGHVNIHTGNQAAQLSQRLEANAFTTGSDIFFNQNKYNPSSSEGKQLLAHELTHVLQQQGGKASRQVIRRQALPTDLGSYPAGERAAIRISWIAIPAGTLPTLNDQFGTTPATAGGTAVTSNRPRGTLVFSANIPASPSTTRDYDLRHGLSNLAYYFQNTSNHLPLNNTITCTLDLSPYGGINGNYRFTYFNHTTGTGASATTAPVFLIEQLGAAEAVPTVTNPADPATAGNFTVGGQTFTLASGWSQQQKAILDQALALVPGNGITQLAGVTFRIGGSVSSEEGHYDEASHTITIRQSAFNDRLNAYEGGGDAVRVILHEIAHAIDRRAVRLAWDTYIAGSNTAATRRTLEAVRTPSGYSYVYDAPNTTHNLEEGAATTAFRTAVISDRTAAGANPPDGISSYSGTNWEENYAEAMTFYMVNRQLFQSLRPNTFAYFNSRYPVAAPAPATGGSTASPQRIQRDTTTSSTAYLSFRQLMAKTVSQFQAYMRTQADWFAAPGLTEDQREDIEYILFFLTEEVRAVFPSTRIRNFQELFDTDGALADERQQQLKAYAAAVSARKHPFEISNFAGSARRATQVGRDILLLQSAFPDYVLRTAMKEFEFKALRDAHYLDDLIAYYTTAVQQPIFQADDGSDFYSFYLFRRSGTSPLHYDSTNLVNRVRNYHRFHKQALDRLIINFNNTSRRKPLTLILHTGLDHNGAFHRDQHLTNVIRNNAMLTLMVEGFASLAEVQAQIEPLATGYGINNRIDQLMFAGHGNARSIQLAGTIGEKVNDAGAHVIGENSQGLSLNTNATATTQLIDEVLRFMDNDTTLPADRQRNSRVVFNACLTNSNLVREAITEGDMAAAQAHVSTFIRDNASLATFLDQYASSQNAGLLTSIGSNASFGSVGLLGPGNTLDIISSGDAAITSSKIDYVERGTEPAGALRAVLESWANNQPDTLAAINRRLARRESNTWELLLIRGAYRKIEADYSTNAEKIRLVGASVEDIAEMKFESNCIKGKSWRSGAAANAVSADTDDFYADLLTAISGAADFRTNNRIKATMLQQWLMKDAAKDADFMNVIGSNTVIFLLQFVDIPYLEDNRGVLARLFTAGTDQAKLRLALHGMMLETNNARSVTHLMSVLAGANSFPAATGVNAALGAAGTEDSILEELGVNAVTAPAPDANGATPATPARTANIRLHGATDNTVYINPIHQYMAFTGYLLKFLYERPSVSSRMVADVSNHRNFYVIGDTADFYAVQHTYEGETIPSVAFLRKRSSRFDSVQNLNE